MRAPGEQPGRDLPNNGPRSCPQKRSVEKAVDDRSMGIIRRIAEKILSLLGREGRKFDVTVEQLVEVGRASALSLLLHGCLDPIAFSLIESDIEAFISSNRIGCSRVRCIKAYIGGSAARFVS